MPYDLQLFTNNAVTLLAAPISSSSTTLTVMPGYGTLFPQPSGPNQFFLVTLENQTATVREIIRVTGRTGDTFTGLVRGQEGTAAVAWGSSPGNDTLVDHRVTAETMRLAMLLPEGSGSALEVQENTVTVGTSADTLNFEGAVTVVGAGNVKTITITGGSGAINGSSPQDPTNIDPGWTVSASNATYSDYQRGFKFFVTLFMPANNLSSTFEVLGNISGNIGANTETVTFNRTARVGYNFLGTVDIVLNKTTKELDLVWTNNEINPIRVMCTRIQHLI